MTKSVKNSIQKPQEAVVENVAEAAPQIDARVEFEQRFDFFMTQFRTVCEEANAPVAIAIVIDPKHPSTPFVFTHGNTYDQAILLANVLREMKQQINRELTV